MAAQPQYNSEAVPNNLSFGTPVDCIATLFTLSFLVLFLFTLVQQFLLCFNFFCQASLSLASGNPPSQFVDLLHVIFYSLTLFSTSVKILCLNIYFLLGIYLAKTTVPSL